MNIPKKILVIKFRNIGDVLLTTPLIASLKAELPESLIYAAVKSGTEDVLLENPDLEKIYILPERQPNEGRIKFIQRTISWVLALRKEKIDVAINTTEGDRGVILAYLVSAKQRWAEVSIKNQKILHKLILTQTTEPKRGRIHTVFRNAHQAATIIKKFHYDVILKINNEEINQAREILAQNGILETKNLIHIHPTSRWMFKCWKAEELAKCINWLHDHGFDIVLTCAPNKKETAYVENLLRACAKLPVNLGGKLRLRETAAISSISRLFLGVDSAPMHMAAALGTPVIGIFGPSGAYDWGPWPNGWKSEEPPYPKKNGIQHELPNTVIQSDLPCVPCGHDGCNGTKQSKCLDELPAMLVINQLRKHLL